LNELVTSSKRRVEYSAVTAFAPVLALFPVWLAAVALLWTPCNWLFGVPFTHFAIGEFLFGIVLFSRPVQRLLFVQPALPERLVPTLCILLAPPAVAFLSWLQLTSQHPGSAPLDAMGHVLFGIAIFFALFLFTQIRRFLRLSFYVSWWAFSFPSAAFTNAALVYAQFESSAFNQALAVAMVAFSTLLILWLLIRTIVAVARNEPQLTD